MPLVTRASLPEEFFDITSSMLLVQPEPQYLFAQLFKMAHNASLMASAGLGLPGRPAIGASGAPYTDAEADRLMMSDPIFTDALTVVSDIGKAPGMTVRLNRPKFTDSTYTEASREITSGSTISTTPIDLSSEQATLTIKRFAGPYSTTVQPYGVDRFDASRALHSVSSMVGTHLKRDFDKTLDTIVRTLLETVQTANIIRPNGFTADNDSTAAGDAPMDFDTISRTEKALDDLNIPTFANGHRVCVLNPTQIAQLKNDSQFARYAENHAPINPVLAQSYFKTVGGLDIFKSTTLGSSANSSSVTIYRGLAFGPGKVGCGVGEMPRVAHSTSDNYGEQALVIWLMYAAFGNMDDRFGCSIRTS